MAMVSCAGESNDSSLPIAVDAATDARSDWCGANEVVVAGSGCTPVGVPGRSCARGSVPDDEAGCTPVLPDDPCPNGLMALPGETACRSVAPCGTTRWGSAPFDDTTEFVDAAYAGVTHDGSESSPYTT